MGDQPKASTGNGLSYPMDTQAVRPHENGTGEGKAFGFGWKGVYALAGVLVAALVVFVVIPHYQFPFPTATSNQLQKVSALAPTEITPIGFAGSSPIPSLWPMRLGYLSALARDLSSADSQSILESQIEKQKRIDPLLPADLAELARKGIYPCARLSGQQRTSCAVGVNIYSVLRSGFDPNSPIASEISDKLATISEATDPDFREILHLQEGLTKESLEIFVGLYLW